MEEDRSLTRDKDRPSLPVALRTLIGLALLVAFGIILLIDYLGPGAWLPGKALDLLGVRTVLERGLLIALVGIVPIGMALKEFHAMVRELGARFSVVSLVTAGLLIWLLQFPGWAYLRNFSVCPWALRNPLMTAVSLICFFTLGFVGYRALQSEFEGVIESVGMFTLGLVYIVIPLGFLLRVRSRWEVVALGTMVGVCKMTDVGAYYCGKFIGGPKMSPTVSPNKTWAGAVGGILGATLASFVLKWLGIDVFSSFAIATVYGILVGFVAITGDLAESVLKRESGFNDSGEVLPGFGGVLDMIDDLLFVAPFTYFFLAVVSYYGL
ncbi:MAG: phosphatidate cytidylyltransferase [Candidatus Brocadiia bacterium]